MGGGSWSSATYSATTGAARAAGTNFRSTTHARTTGTWKLHEQLDPKTANKAGPHSGHNVREAMDSDEHPTSTAITVLFDVTGSMMQVPQQLQGKLPQLLGVLLRKGYVEHPQILFGGIGDEETDHVPLQIAQFESDNRMDEHLDNMLLEGNGGGQKTESYQLAAYFMSRHVYMDCWEKRGHKGYLFLIGDEMNKTHVRKAEVERLIGTSGMEADIPTEDIYRELLEKYEVFFLLPQGTSYYGHTDVLEHWQNLLGADRVLQLESIDAICETIAMSIGLVEGTVDIDAAAEDLLALGSDQKTVDHARSATTALAQRSAGGVAVADAPPVIEDDEEDDGLERV